LAKIKVEQVVEEMLLPIMDDLQCELVDIEYKKEGSHWYLRIYIDKHPGSVTIDDCQAVSERISDLLDERDPIPHSYFLEVSSPGLDRALKKDSDFERYKGFKVDVSLYKPINGKKKFTGELIGLEDNQLLIQDRNEVLSFSRTDVAMVRLTVEF
jgi:ribosome maturation factor RimP